MSDPIRQARRQLRRVERAVGAEVGETFGRAAVRLCRRLQRLERRMVFLRRRVLGCGGSYPTRRYPGQFYSTASLIRQYGGAYTARDVASLFDKPLFSRVGAC